MLRLSGRGSTHTCDGLSRRDFLQAGVLGAAAGVMGGRALASTVMRGRVIGILDGMIGPAATRHRGVTLKRQHQGEQQRESHAKGRVQPHSGLKHTTARGIIHATRVHLTVRSTA